MSLKVNRTYRRKDDGSIIRVDMVCNSGYVISHLQVKRKNKTVVVCSDIMLEKEGVHYEEYKPVIMVRCSEELFNVAFSLIANRDINWNMNGYDESWLLNRKELYRRLWDANVGTDGVFKSYDEAEKCLLSRQEKDDVEEYAELHEWAFAMLTNMKELFSKSRFFADIPLECKGFKYAED